MFQFFGAAFSGGGRGIAVGRYDTSKSTKGAILATTDGGLNWTQTLVSTGGWALMAVAFRGGESGVIVGQQGIVYSSTNGGQTWSPHYGSTSENLLGVSLGKNLSMIVGEQGTILLGSLSSWVQAESGTKRRLYGACWVDSVTAIAVGDSGTLLRTTNSGVSWSLLPLWTTNSLRAVSFSDVIQGTIVGEGGTILNTLQGGIPSAVTPSREVALPLSYALSQNYPNPFNGMTNFEYRIADCGFVSVKIFDILGRQVATLVDGEKLPGVYRVQWNAANSASGVYFCRMQARGFVQSRKVMLLR
jgi:photosystem II stability/assembly factor-like uncharacterized protein